jgi:NAD(P)H dehydrogenase (quinone)
MNQEEDFMSLKHAVIIAHPLAKSFTHAMASAYAAAARVQGGTVVVRDLYAMDFDPRLKGDEIPKAGSFGPAPDVITERALLKDVDVFALFYPLWFNAPPAILKGYFDRVFSMGFGFGPKGGVQAPLLTGRKLISFTSSGAPETWVRETGALAALTTLFDGHISSMCGLQIIDHVHIGEVVPGLTKQIVDEARHRVSTTVSRHFHHAKVHA